MKRLIFPGLVIILFFTTCEVHSQDVITSKSLKGSWMGKLAVGGVELRLVFNIKLNDKDSLIATADSPDQGVKNIPLGKVIHTEDNLTIKAPLLMGEYKGTIMNDSTINGTWSQRGASYPMNIKKLKTEFSLNRPQEPKSKLPYISEDVTFTNTKFKIKLAGTLTIPEGNGPFTAVIMITGSGGQNRNEEILGHKPFLVISDWLTRNGIAVLRFDDRGVGKSQGSQFNANSADFATDAEAAFEFLRTNNHINPNAIGLIGHSEGGLIAPIIAASNPGIAFIISLAGPGVTGQQIILKQSEDISKISGVPENKIRKSAETNKKLYAVLRKETDNKKAETKIISLYSEIIAAEKLSGEDSAKSVNQLKATFGASSYTWLRYFLFTDPARFWKKVKCPVLALNGKKDLQVSAAENLPAIEKAVKSGGNRTIRAIEFNGLNHLFQHCDKGLPQEYGNIEETISPEVLRVMSDWILDLKLSN